MGIKQSKLRTRADKAAATAAKKTKAIEKIQKINVFQDEHTQAAVNAGENTEHINEFTPLVI